MKTNKRKRVSLELVFRQTIFFFDFFFCSTFVKVKRSVVHSDQGKKTELSPIVFLLQSEYSLCPEPELLIHTFVLSLKKKKNFTAINNSDDSF